MDKQFTKEATLALAAQKLYYDYCTAREKFDSVEPEHFYDLWVAQILQNANDQDKSLVWKFFIRKLMNVNRSAK